MARPAPSRAMQPQQRRTENSIHPMPRVALDPDTGFDLSRIPVRGPSRLQAKLVLGTPGDVFEQEADRVADAVMEGQAPRVARDAGSPQSLPSAEEASAKDGCEKAIEDEEDVDPKKREPAKGCGCGGACNCDDETKRVQAKAVTPPAHRDAGVAGQPLEPAIGAGIETMHGAGRPLMPSERQFMESRFAADFGGIRLHTGEQSDTYNRALGARAFTLGNDIFFRAGEYMPGRSASRRLLAHELTHAVQQGAARQSPGDARDVGIRGTVAPAVQRDLAVPPPNPTAVAPILTEAQIADAIDFNSKQFKDPKSLENIRDVIGISPTPAVSDRELALTIAQWQATFNLTVDGKAGDLTVGTIVRELKAEKLSPDALKLLLDLHGTVPAGRATLNFLPVLHDRVPPSWGITHNDDPIFDISVFAAAGGWECRITKADQRSHQGTRLLAGVVEVTPALVAAEADCARLQTMITSLNSVASQGANSGFYMLAAVQAHEDVHITQYRAGLAPHYTTLRTAIEALTVPLASHNTAASAKAAIKALPAFTTAMATFHTADVAVNNATGAHAPVAPFNTAEHGVVDPMITTIRARRTALTCPP